jgi:polyhydroxyalkanoate synthesis repressor PhaR
MAENPPSKFLIKRYGGRRLYNTVSARYLTLDDLARMVREGRRLQIWDASTGEDITAKTLIQAALKGTDNPGAIVKFRDVKSPGLSGGVGKGFSG